MKRTFRYNSELGRMVEVTPPDGPDGSYVQDDIEPFRSPRDGTLIKSRSQMREYMHRHNLVHYDPTNKGESDRYATGHSDRALREQLWERVDKVMQRKRHGR